MVPEPPNVWKFRSSNDHTSIYPPEDKTLKLVPTTDSLVTTSGELNVVPTLGFL